MKKFNPKKKKKKSPGLEIMRSYDDVKNFTTTFALCNCPLFSPRGIVTAE